MNTLRRTDMGSSSAKKLEADELLGQALQVRPRSDEHLRDWITVITGQRVPNKAVCTDHDPPFQFVSDLFFHRKDEALVLGPRGGGKTASTASLHLANGYHKPGFEVSHIGAIENQATRLYAFYRQGLRHEFLKEEAPDPHIRDTTWRNGSRIEILPGTEAQTQGGHPHLVTFDELEQGRRQPYENAKSMPVEWRERDGKRHLGQFLAMSTRNSSRGLMQRALDEAKARATRVYSFCILETIEPCDGQDGRPDCNGEQCPIWQWCEGRAKDADGWRSRDEILATYRRSGEDTWLSQHLCRQPDLRALIYSNFGVENITKDAEYRPHAGRLYIGYDFGFTDPTHINLYQVRDGRLYQFDELVGSARSERDWVRDVVRRICALPDYDGPDFALWERIWTGRELWPHPWPNAWPEAVGDPSAAQMRFEFREHGIGARRGKVRHNVEEGQDVLRTAIRSAGGERRLFVHPRCVETIRSFENFRAQELQDGSFGPRPDGDPANHRFSHGCDASRYLSWVLRWMFGVRRAGGNGAEQQE